MEYLHYYWLAAVVPIGLMWAAVQDFVTGAETTEARDRVRRTAQIVALVGLVHPAIALVGFDMVRNVDFDETSPAAGRVTLAVLASCLIAVAGAIVLFTR